MNNRGEVLKVLDQSLGLKGKALSYPDDMQLLGNLPELDSMAVVTVITALEERFGFSIEDDEISGDTFSTVGAVVRFVEEKLAP